MTRTERQTLAIERWKAAKCKGTFVFPTGFGKTRTALTAIDRVTSKNPNVRIRIVVPTKVLKKQWEELIERQQWDLDIEVLVINTAAKYPFKCDFLICDEIQHNSSITFRQLFNNCHPTFIIGLTATYERLDGLEKEVVDHYCPVCDKVSLEEALENNWLSPYKEYKVLVNVDLTEYNKANSEFLRHFSFFDFNFQLALNAVTNVFAQQALAKQYNCTLSEVKAHAYAWKRALQFRKNFIANHPKKLEIAKKIIAARSDKKIITFNTSIEQCKAYGFGYVVHSKQSKKKNAEILDEFSHCSSGCIHSSKMLIEGLDCPGLSVAIITGFNSSQINKRQSIGRIIRFEEGKEAEVFTLVLAHTVEEQWYYKSSEELNYIELSEEDLDKVLNHDPLIQFNTKTQEEVANALLRI